MNSPFVMIIFGATGDLMQNKLLPALFSLFSQKKLPEEFHIIGFSRRELSDNEFTNLFIGLSSKEGWGDFAKHLQYQRGSFEDVNGYSELIEKLNTFDKKLGACITRFFYLATPPQHYESILNFLQKTKLSEGCGQRSSKWTRIIVEKPFGKDLETAIALDKKLSEIFEEKQIFRVDHYLGKETVQNILAFRFANGIFDPVWNKQYLDHVQITFAEKKGIEGRGNFFDGVGILRDVGQNHLMQLVASVAMEQPKSFTKEDLRDERAKVIKALKYIEEKDVNNQVVRGQYKGYLSEKNIPPNSNTETFAAIKFFVNTPRFQNVPFYVRAGKKMPRNTVEISLIFLQTCHILFKEYGCPEIGNVLTIKIQPDEGISIRMIAKKPGIKLALEPVTMDFTYQEAFMTKGVEAYEKVLLDIFAGDQMLFNRSDELSSSWEFITKILNGWKDNESGIMNYEQGTWGPQEANALIEKDGRKWL
ncbi:MAG: glucose-6-phosphate dehydrogenase [Candidatus Levybacteria bacterium]|nr:glucose-6-phosphate dehydrogenase [Candidatus Levybacteria bacterium]